MTETPTKTDRERFYDKPPAGEPWFTWSMINTARMETIREAMFIFVQAWFDTYEDETDLPAWFWTFLDKAEETFHEEFFDRKDDDDDDDGEVA